MRKFVLFIFIFLFTAGVAKASDYTTSWKYNDPRGSNVFTHQQQVADWITTSSFVDLGRKLFSSYIEFNVEEFTSSHYFVSIETSLLVIQEKGDDSDVVRAVWSCVVDDNGYNKNVILGWLIKDGLVVNVEDGGIGRIKITTFSPFVKNKDQLAVWVSVARELYPKISFWIETEDGKKIY